MSVGLTCLDERDHNHTRRIVCTEKREVKPGVPYIFLQPPCQVFSATVVLGMLSSENYKYKETRLLN